MAHDIICSSCKVKVTNTGSATNFMCPQCGKSNIVRCEKCRKLAAKYTCIECGFTGPN